MVFLSIALRYLAFCVPVFVLYVLALKRTELSPQILSYFWTAANLVIVGYLVYWGWAAAELSLVGSFLHVVGATFVVLIPLVGLMVLVIRHRPADDRAGDTDSQHP